MSAIENMIDSVVKPIALPNPLPLFTAYATHEGILNLGGNELKVYVLNTGQRIISEDSLKAAFGEDFIDIFIRSGNVGV